MRSFWFRIGPKSNDWCSYSKEIWTQRHTEREMPPEETKSLRASAMGRQAEVGAMDLQVKECWLPPEVRRGSPGPSLELVEGAWSCTVIASNLNCAPGEPRNTELLKAKTTAATKKTVPVGYLAWCSD